MLFNSYIFIFLFLPLSFLIYFLLNMKSYFGVSKLFLVGASLFFYGWWNISYLPILIFSIFFNFSIGNFIALVNSLNKRYILLLFGLIVNIGLLGYFKYSDFLIDNLNAIFFLNIPSLNLVLPLAISFFTFQQITYLVDSYRGLTKGYNFIDYMVFVTFFPQLIAGPIVHHSEMIGQFASTENKFINYRNISRGIFIFVIGLFKKVVIADSLAIYVTDGFDLSSELSFFDSWVTSLAYTFELYYDFSGYTDMAIGIALLFNIKLPINFYSPYKALNIQDFWRRWHITLSRFLRDYIYIPLGGNRYGREIMYINLLLTFLIAGIWHGAGWTFIFWGLLHGMAIVIYKVWNIYGVRLHSIVAWVITFVFINFSWVFFRAKNFEDAIKVLKGMFGFKGVDFDDLIRLKFAILSLFILLFISIFFKNSIDLVNDFRPTWKMVIFSSSLFFISVLFLRRVSEFLYFNF